MTWWGAGLLSEWAGRLGLRGVLPRPSPPLWIPAFAGMTKWGAGMTSGGRNDEWWGAGLCPWLVVGLRCPWRVAHPSPPLWIPAFAGMTKWGPAGMGRRNDEGRRAEAGLPPWSEVLPHLPPPLDSGPRNSSVRRLGALRRRPPHFVIPAKAGIQRGGEGVWQGFQGVGGQAGLPRAPAPRFVIPAPPLRHAGPPTSSFRRRPESRGAAGNGAIPRPPPVDPPNFNPIRISLKIPIKSSNDLAETPKGREAGKRLTYNSVRSSLIK